MNKQKRRIVGSWLVLGCFLVFLMVVIGGITRLSGSGLSMVDWKPLIGAIPPIGQEAWQEAFSKYMESPQFQKVNYGFVLADFRSIFWWEYIHRLLGRLIGLVFLVPFVFFITKGWLPNQLIKKCAVMFFLGGLQGLLGWYMVKSGLVDDPRVSHFRLAAHLVTASILFGYILWVALDVLMERPKKMINTRGLRLFSGGLFLLLLLQIVYGAFVAGLKAGLVYNTFPKMGEYWIAEGVTAITPLWLSLVEGLAGVQFVHRYLAYAVVAVVFIIWLIARRLVLSKEQQIIIQVLIVVVVMQFILGVLTLLNAAPFSLAVLHQMLALILFGNVVLLNHRIAVH